MTSDPSTETESSSPRNFTYRAQPSRIVFGRGSLKRLALEVEALGTRKARVLCTPDQRRQAEAAILGELSRGVLDGAQMHVRNRERETGASARRDIGLRLQDVDAVLE